jgi:hypothetical protein
MSTRRETITSISVWNTACPVWYNVVFVIVGTIFLSGQHIWILLNQVIFVTCKETSHFLNTSESI